MSTKPICIYHGGCDDGFGAAFAVWKRFGDEFEYYPGVYQNPPPDVRGRDVYVVDFSYKHPVMESLCKTANSVTILDHHKSAMEDLAGLDKWAAENGYDVTLVFDMGRSGAMITWQHMHFDKPAPELIEYIQARDLNKHRSLHKGAEVSIALRSYPHDFEIWSRLTVGELAKEGEVILRYYNNLLDQLRKNVARQWIGDWLVPVINANYCFASDLAGELSKGEPFAAAYYYDASGKNFSLRSQPDGVDVQEIARQYGGGGHKQAAGFRIPLQQCKPEGGDGASAV